MLAAQLYSVTTLDECYAAKEQFAPYDPNSTIQGASAGNIPLPVGHVCFFRNCTDPSSCSGTFKYDLEWFLSEFDTHHVMCGTAEVRCICHETRPAPPPPAIPNAGVAYGASTGCPNAELARARPTYESECRHWADGMNVSFYHTYNPKGAPTGACVHVGNPDGAPMPAEDYTDPIGHLQHVEQTGVYWTNVEGAVEGYCVEDSPNICHCVVAPPAAPPPIAPPLCGFDVATCTGAYDTEAEAIAACPAGEEAHCFAGSPNTTTVETCTAFETVGRWTLFGPLYMSQNPMAGSCEEAGLTTITSENDCQAAMASFGTVTDFLTLTDAPSGRMPGCLVDSFDLSSFNPSRLIYNPAPESLFGWTSCIKTSDTATAPQNAACVCCKTYVEETIVDFDKFQTCLCPESPPSPPPPRPPPFPPPPPHAPSPPSAPPPPSPPP